LIYANIFYKNTSGAWVQILQVTSSATGCGAYDCWNNSWGATGYGGFTYSNSSSADYSNDINIYDRDAGNGFHYGNISFNRLPSDIEISSTGSFSFKAEGQWANHGNQDDATDNFGADISSTSLQAINGVTGVTATNSQCGKITVNWPAPSQAWQNAVSCSNYGNYTYEVFCNNVSMGAATSATSWSVGIGTTINTINFVMGTQYDFSIKTIWRPAGNTKFAGLSGPISTNVAGKSKGAPPQPTNMSASKNLCNNEIDIDFSYNDNPSVFKIFRSLSLNGTYNFLDTITANDRTYHDVNSITRGVNYYYLINAINECGILSANTKANGISPSEPIMASNITAVTNTLTNFNRC